MANLIQDYFSRLSKGFGQGWNRFWFTPSDPWTVSVLRVVAGVAAVLYLAAYSFGLAEWFGPQGWLPVQTVQSVMETTPGEGAAYQYSYLNVIDSPGLLWTVHAAGILVAALFAAGLFTRVTAVLTLIVVLSYIHRAPVLSAQFEPILAMMVFYLCFAPCGRYLSLDRWRKQRGATAVEADRSDAPSWAATVSLRLIQIHLAGLYLLMGLSKLGAVTWWEGGATWWLMAQSQSRLVDLTFLRSNVILINAWTHALVLFELTYGVLIWNRLARPLLIAVSVVMWLLTALVTGLIGYCLLMIAAGAAFVPAGVWRRVLGGANDASALAAPTHGKKANEAATTAV